MAREEKIAGAAEIIVTEYTKHGEYISLPDALVLAQKLYRFWAESVRYRDVYRWPVVDGPIIITEIRDVGRAIDCPPGADSDRGQDAKSG